MKDLYSINSHWFSGILSSMSDEELKAAFDILQEFFALCDVNNVSLYYDLFDLLEASFVEEIVKRFFQKVA